MFYLNLLYFHEQHETPVYHMDGMQKSKTSVLPVVIKN